MNTEKFIKNKKLAKPWIFFTVTYCWTWTFLAIAYALNLSAETGGSLGVALILLGLCGPAVAGISFVYLTLNNEGQKDYWKRVFDRKLISFKWYLAIFLLLPTITILSAILSGHWNSFSFAHKLPSLSLTVLSIPLVAILEELGWRGYVLDRLQERYSALWSCIVLGLLWGLWHLPVFFLPGSIFGLMPFASLMFWLYMFHEIIISIFFGWIYNNTHRSILSAILLHMLLAFFANTGLIPWDKPEHLYNVILWTLLAIGIIYCFGYKKFKNP